MGRSMGEEVSNIREMVRAAARSLTSCATAFPRRENLEQERIDASAAQLRGYYNPDEDERLRNVYTRYLSVRAAFWETVETLGPILEEDDELDWEQRLYTFAVAFASAAILVRTASYMVELAKDRPVVWKKLDEGEQRYGIPRKSFTHVYESLSSTKRMWRYHESWRFYELHKSDLASLLVGAEYGAVWKILEEEEPHFESRRRDYLRRRLNFGLFDFQRRHRSGYHKVMFHLFKLGGSAIADMKQPFVKPVGAPKRVTKEVCERAAELMQPGDILVTRHDDALSNLFLPGFWPHAALYIGDEEERVALGVSGLPKLCRQTGGKVCVLESKKDGVLLRALEETLELDAFVVLRPNLSEEDRAKAIARALEHEGKLYDFLFDFRQSDRLACTGLIYRTYHGLGGVEFQLHERAGRVCLSAEDILDQSLVTRKFTVQALYGVGSDEILTGENALQKLLASYDSQVEMSASDGTL